MSDREIKFRVWDGEEMWPVSHLELHDGGVWAATRDAAKSGSAENEENLPWASFGSGRGDLEHPVLMQYTGLADVEGQEIYEGDTVRFEIDSGKELVGEVVYREDYAMYMIDCGGGQFLPLHREAEIPGFRVIGNRFENPKLLKDA